MRSLMPVSEYGCRVLTSSERHDLYELRRGKPDESMLARIAAGISVKRRILETLRMVPRHRALVVVPRRRRKAA